MTLVSIILTYLDGDGRAMTYSEQVPLICALDGNRKTRNDETRSFRESQIRHCYFTMISNNLLRLERHKYIHEDLEIMLP